MNKKFFIFSTIILALALIIVLFVAFVLPGLEKPDEIVEEATLEPVKLRLDLEFESEDDLKWFQIFTVYGEPIEDPQGALVDGALRFGGENLYAFTNMSYDLEPGLVVHIRNRSGGDVCSGLGIERAMDSQSKGFGLENCADDVFSASLVHNRDHYGDSVFATLPMTGSVPGFRDEWVDAIFWLNESGDGIYYFVNNPNDTAQIMYGSVALPQDWQYARWRIGISVYYDMQEGSDQAPGYKDIDFIRTASGTLQSYLNEYVPAYQENKEELDVFLTGPAQAMPELLPEQQGNDQPEGEEGMSEEGSQPEGENNGEAEMAEEQSQPEEETTREEVPKAFSGVLTWPDPVPILPYLTELENLEGTCKECENTVYGVDMTPFGYVFTVSFGSPPDGGANLNSYVKEWIQLYDKPVNNYELLYYYKQIGRFPSSSQAGEPMQFIYQFGGPEVNLMMYKENVLVTAGVYNVGNYYDPASKMVMDTVALLPDEGLAVPELVSEPSLELDEEAAAEILNAVWLGAFDAPAVPEFSFTGRDNFWLNLKAPVEKVELAVYHPDTQTYFSYAWMDNPPVDTDIAMTGSFFDGERASPNGYYRGKYGGELLVRVWADGKLINEFSVEG